LPDLKFKEPITLKQAKEILGCSHERAIRLVHSRGLIKAEQQYVQGKTSQTGKLWILEAEDVRKIKVQHDQGVSWKQIASFGSYSSSDDWASDLYKAQGKISPFLKGRY
jgi:hypothetical protein